MNIAHSFNPFRANQTHVSVACKRSERERHRYGGYWWRDFLNPWVIEDCYVACSPSRQPISSRTLLPMIALTAFAFAVVRGPAFAADGSEELARRTVELTVIGSVFLWRAGVQGHSVRAIA